MRVVAFQTSPSVKSKGWLEQSFRLRAKIFSGRLGWDVVVDQGREVDYFDHLCTDYLVLFDDDGTVIGTVRFLPTSGPTMLTTVFSYLLTSGQALCPGLVEASRFCIDTESFKSQEPINQATRTLLSGMVEWALHRKYPLIAVVVDLRMERVLRRTGWPLLRISGSYSMGKVVGVAGYLSVSQMILNNLRPTNYIFTSCEDRAVEYAS